MTIYKQTEPALSSWSCKGCINTHFEITKNGIAEYCTPMREGRHRKEWQGEHIECLDKITGGLT